MPTTAALPITDPHESISPWWLRTVLIVMVIGVAGLLWITSLAYDNAPPIPGQVVGSDGTTVATGADISAGQAVFLRYGLMANGSIWGHGGYLGPDYAADALHRKGLDVAELLSQQSYGKSLDALDDMQKAAVHGQVPAVLRVNRYDAGADTLQLTEGETRAWQEQDAYWRHYLSEPGNNAGLKANFITDETELRQLGNFVSWAAWASVAHRPGKDFSYTNNFPYDPLVGNHHTSATLIWSAISFFALLGGIAGVLMIFGKFDYLGWMSRGERAQQRLPVGQAGPGQRALVKFFVIVSLLFLGQTLLGGAIAHYRIEPDGFYGIPLEKLFPSNLLRTWHLQTAIFWIATAYVAAALFLARTLRSDEPRGFANGINLLFVAFAFVIFGSLLGEWAGISQWLGDWWFWWGNQGWEYLELGRAWQFLLIAGLFVWFLMLLWVLRGGAVEDERARPIVRMFLLGALAIPVFYIPAVFFGAETNYTVVDTWRFWIVHLWVEGFFEFFATCTVALVFYQLGFARRNTALRVIYLDAILYFGGGMLGTGHHWYFTGQTNVNLAIAGVVSALEVVPLTLLTLDAWDFVRTTRDQVDSDGKPVRLTYKWTLYFLMAVGFWNFMGAGVFGFFLNTPIVSYYEVGTIFTPAHAHGALMGVFGMLALGLMTLVLRGVCTQEQWPAVERWVKYSFWGTNIGLAMMISMSLLPGGILQIWDVLQNGYWHARSQEYTRSTLALTFEWLRFPGDMVFIFAGALPMFIASLKTWQFMRQTPPATAPRAAALGA
ncbi:MAG: cbb3-type cytochrome c oxidase subunit I [Ottowia sp.]|nr:cbb3-type cytochrome c oxidase subunit I [Ottowia sp.]